MKEKWPSASVELTRVLVETRPRNSRRAPSTGRPVTSRSTPFHEPKGALSGAPGTALAAPRPTAKMTAAASFIVLRKPSFRSSLRIHPRPRRQELAVPGFSSSISPHPPYSNSRSLHPSSRHFLFKFSAARQSTPERLRIQWPVRFSTFGTSGAHGRHTFSFSRRPHQWMGRRQYGPGPRESNRKFRIVPWYRRNFLPSMLSE